MRFPLWQPALSASDHYHLVCMAALLVVGSAKMYVPVPQQAR